MRSFDPDPPLRRRFLRFRYVIRMLGALGLRIVKACAGALMGRAGLSDEIHFVIRHPVWRMVGPAAARSISCQGLPEEGAGSQALMYISTITFARGAGLTYLHQPFRQISHSDRPMQEWTTAWESMFNFGMGEAQWAPTVDRLLMYNPYEYSGWLGGSHRNAHFDACLLKLLPELRGKYRSANSARRQCSQLVIAVHVRRGDVSQTRNDFLYTGVAAVLRTCELLHEVLERRGLKHCFRIFSEAAPEELAALLVLKPELMVDVDSLSTFRQLVDADVLVMAKGAFSYVGGMLSEGIKLFDPYYRPLPDWIGRAPDGSFSVSEFERQLVALLASRPRQNERIPSQPSIDECEQKSKSC